MAQGILVFIEERQGAIKKSSLEALSAARRLADGLGENVTAVCIGPGEFPKVLAQHGADVVVRARHELLSAYSAEGLRPRSSR